MTDAPSMTVVIATVDAIGRTGARSFEVGHLDDDPPGRWYATARYAGAKVSCDNQPTPDRAVLGLYGMLAAGGGCTTCRRTVALAHTDRLVDGARMRRGVYQTRTATGPVERYCVRRLEAAGWTSCEQATP